MSGHSIFLRVLRKLISHSGSSEIGGEGGGGGGEGWLFLDLGSFYIDKCHVECEPWKRTSPSPYIYKTRVSVNAFEAYFPLMVKTRGRVKSRRMRALAICSS